MSKFICPIHDNNPNWTCFDLGNGGIHHFDGEVSPISILPSEEHSSKVDVNAFMQAVFEDIDIGIVIIEDSDLISYGTVKQLAEKHLGWVNENKTNCV